MNGSESSQALVWQCRALGVTIAQYQEFLDRIEEVAALDPDRRRAGTGVAELLDAIGPMSVDTV